MKQNLVWPLFLTGITALLVIFTSFLSVDLYRYYQLKCQVPAEHLEASVLELSSNRFRVELDYFYQVNKHRYSCHQSLSKGIYKNDWLAKEKIQSIKDRGSQVWYHPDKPHLGVIYKEFPYKRLFSTSVLFILFAYFSFLGRFVLKRVS